MPPSFVLLALMSAFVLKHSDLELGPGPIAFSRHENGSGLENHNEVKMLPCLSS